MLSRSVLALAALAFASHSLAQTCESYGVDFQSGGSYFINTLSNADFTCVTEWSGCQNDTGYVMLIDPNGNQYDCSDIQTQPNNTAMMSTCPIEQSAMISGDWSIYVLTNNGNGDPYSGERIFYVDAAPQATVTVTPTITYNTTSFTVFSSTNTSTVFTTLTQNATTTITVPAKTSFYTTTPQKVTQTSTTTVTKTLRAVTKTTTNVYVTITPQCTVPPRQSFPDPFNLPPAHVQLPYGFHFYKKRADTGLDAESVRERFEAIKARQMQAADAAAEKRDMQFVKRSADVPTITTTVTTPIESTTVTYYSSSTAYNLTITTDTVYTTLPPKTVSAGTETETITAPTPTKTIYTVAHAITTSTKTWIATISHITTITPAASVTACKKAGGYFGLGWNGWGL